MLNAGRCAVYLKGASCVTGQLCPCWHAWCRTQHFINDISIIIIIVLIVAIDIIVHISFLCETNTGCRRRTRLVADVRGCTRVHVMQNAELFSRRHRGDGVYNVPS